MLVAGASMSLIAPFAAQASDIVNLEEIDSYMRGQTKSSRIDSNTFINEVSEDIAKLNSHVDGLEVKQNEFEASGFSDTTVMSGKVIFDLGAVEGGIISTENPVFVVPVNADGTVTADVDTDAVVGADSVAVDTEYATTTAAAAEAVGFQYTYQIDLNTSFNGDDNLYVRLKSGNATDIFSDKTQGTYLSSSNGYDDALKVDKIWYSFLFGENHRFWVGPRIENYYMHGASPSIYKPITKQFKLGGNGAAYGASTNSGVGWAYNADNGFSISSNVVSKQNGGNLGFLTNESDGTNWSTQVAYTTPKFHVSYISAAKYNGWEDSYYSTTLGKDRPDGDSTNHGLRAYWRPDETGSAMPEISVGYDMSTVEDQAADTDAFFVGLTWKDTLQADDKVGIAFGQPQTADNDPVDPFAWEAYYSFKINDSVTMTPAIFGSNDRTGNGLEDVTGYVLQTTFKF